MLKSVLATVLLLVTKVAFAETADKSSSTGPIDSDRSATVVSQGLRIRSLPSVSGSIVASLSKGDELRVASRTSWNDSIDGITAPWYEVSKGWAAGWCFGGYLAVPKDIQIPDSPMAKGSSSISHSYFGNADGSRVGNVPYQNMRILGVEQPVDIPSRDGFDAHYDPINCYVLVELRKAPSGQIEVAAVDPKGMTYKGKPAYEVYQQNEAGYKYANSVIGFFFRPPASAHSGLWKIELAQGRVKLRSVGISLPTTSATLSRNPFPDPFAYPSAVDAKQDDTLFLFGCNEQPNSDLTIVFYRINYENMNPFNMIPRAAGIVHTDGSGRFETKFSVGIDCPAGSYKLATGIEELKINLFDVYMEIH
jgi:hypothetical protein